MFVLKDLVLRLSFSRCERPYFGVCVCEREGERGGGGGERERERESMCVCVCVREHAHVCEPVRPSGGSP